MMKPSKAVMRKARLVASKLLPTMENFKGMPMKRGLMQMRDYTGWTHKEPK